MLIVLPWVTKCKRTLLARAQRRLAVGRGGEQTESRFPVPAPSLLVQWRAWKQLRHRCPITLNDTTDRLATGGGIGRNGCYGTEGYLNKWQHEGPSEEPLHHFFSLAPQCFGVGWSASTLNQSSARCTRMSLAAVKWNPRSLIAGSTDASLGTSIHRPLHTFFSLVLEIMSILFASCPGDEH